jgi:hypothetical protein
MDVQATSVAELPYRLCARGLMTELPRIQEKDSTAPVAVEAADGNDERVEEEEVGEPDTGQAKI